MNYFIIVETEAGLIATEVPPGWSAEEAAVALDAVVVDPGPYGCFEDAQDAMYALPADPDQRARIRE